MLKNLWSAPGTFCLGILTNRSGDVLAIHPGTDWFGDILTGHTVCSKFTGMNACHLISTISNKYNCVKSQSLYKICSISAIFFINFYSIKQPETVDHMSLTLLHVTVFIFTYDVMCVPNMQPISVSALQVVCAALPITAHDGLTGECDWSSAGELWLVSDRILSTNFPPVQSSVWRLSKVVNSVSD